MWLRVRPILLRLLSLVDTMISITEVLAVLEIAQARCTSQVTFRVKTL